eukprot:1150502-Pelagomonas_calceolata.AAC.5
MGSVKNGTFTWAQPNKGCILSMSSKCAFIPVSLQQYSCEFWCTHYSTVDFALCSECLPAGYPTSQGPMQRHSQTTFSGWAPSL